MSFQEIKQLAEDYRQHIKYEDKIFGTLLLQDIECYTWFLVERDIRKQILQIISQKLRLPKS